MNEPIINEQADREIGRLSIVYFLVTLALFVAVPLLMIPVNLPGNPLFGMHRFLDTASTFVALLPFFIGFNRISAARLRWGRKLVEERQWRQAAAALELFAGFGQRFLDNTGEGHYLLAQALGHLGKTQEAERARRFVLKHRASGPWAERLRRQEQEQPRFSHAKGTRPAIAPDAVLAAKEENKPRPAKRRRRF